MPEPRDVPEDFVRSVTSMEGGCYLSLARRWHAGLDTIQRWLRETGLTERVTNPPPPKSWGATAPTKNQFELQQHYQVAKPIIKRWIAQTGVQPKPKTPPITKRGERRERAKAKYSSPKDLEAAANHLRKFYANVHSCAIYLTRELSWGESRGLPNKGKGFYYIDGVGVVTNEDMLTLARKNGHETRGI